jgi:hypothetical protein
LLVQEPEARRWADKVAAATLPAVARTDTVGWQEAEIQPPDIAEEHQAAGTAAGQADHTEKSTADHSVQPAVEIEVGHCALSAHGHMGCHIVAFQADTPCRSP